MKNDAKVELCYEGYVGYKGVVVPEINAVIENGIIMVESGNRRAKLKVVVKPPTYSPRDCIFEKKKSQLNLLKEQGIKHLLESQKKGSLFFHSTRGLMEGILELNAIG